MRYEKGRYVKVMDKDFGMDEGRGINQALDLDISREKGDRSLLSDFPKQPVRLEEDENNYESALDAKETEKKAVEVMQKHFPKTVDKETNHELPYRTIYQGRKLRLSKSRLWLFQSFGGFTMGEIRAFVKRYSKELTLDEQAAIQLYLKEASGDREASEMVWDLHKKIFETMKSVYIEEMKQQRSDEEKMSNSKLENMLEKIGEKILETDKSAKKRRKK